MVCIMTEKEKGAIVFTDDDLPLEGREHNKALFIKAEVKRKSTSCVMVDDGSAINVCPSFQAGDQSFRIDKFRDSG